MCWLVADVCDPSKTWWLLYFQWDEAVKVPPGADSWSGMKLKQIRVTNAKERATKAKEAYLEVPGSMKMVSFELKLNYSLMTMNVYDSTCCDSYDMATVIKYDANDIKINMVKEKLYQI